MAQLPQELIEAWHERQGPVIFTTVAPDGTPNAIYATCVARFGDDRIVVADNYFHKTRQNLFDGSSGALLFMTKDGSAYQVKGPLEYDTEGEVYADMKRWNPDRHPGHGAAALVANAVYKGSRQLL